jgi:exonuclease III
MATISLSHTLSIVTWNIDGLPDQAKHEARHCSEAARLINNEQPDVVLLQEVLPSTVTLYASLLGAEGYQIISPSSNAERRFLGPYYTAVLIKKCRISSTEQCTGTEPFHLESCRRIQYRGDAY